MINSKFVDCFRWMFYNLNFRKQKMELMLGYENGCNRTKMRFECIFTIQ